MKSDEIEKPRVIKLGPTGISTVTISGTTIHSGLKIPVNSFKSLTDKQRTLLRNKLIHVQLDEISMVSSKLLLDIHKRLNEIFGVANERPFAGKSIVVCGDLYQLPPVMAKPVFSTEGSLINVFKLWHNFKLAELDETMRQKGDTAFIDLLNEIRVGELSSENEMVLKSRIIRLEDSNYPWNALHLYAENESVNVHNLKMLERLSSENFVSQSIDVFPKSFSDVEKNKVKNMKQTDTGGLAGELKLKIGARVMLVSNIDIDDRLINGQLGTVTNFKSRDGQIQIIYIKFDDTNDGLQAQKKDRFALTINSIPVERTEASFSLNKRQNNSSSMVIRTQFPLMLAYACTVHKVQGLILDSVVISFDLRKQKFLIQDKCMLL